MRDENTTPTQVVGPPILTVFFKNKRDEDDNPIAGAQEVMDFSVNGGALIAQNMDAELMIFPLAEIEYASLTPQLAGGGADASDEGNDNGDEAAAEGESGVVLPFSPDFGGGSSDSEDASS